MQGLIIKEEVSSSSTEYRPLSSSKLTAVPVRPLSSGFATSPLMTTRLPRSAVCCFLLRISVAMLQAVHTDKVCMCMKQLSNILRMTTSASAAAFSEAAFSAARFSAAALASASAFALASAAAFASAPAFQMPPQVSHKGVILSVCV